MAIILCLETTTTNCSVALAKEGKLLALREDKSKNYSHAERLHVFIEEVLEETNLSFNNLSAIAVSKGPGSYTGLRIGVSAAKGLCFSLDIPLLAIDTLQALSLQYTKEEISFFVPMLDARRMEVFTAVYKHTGDCLHAAEAKVLTENAYQEFLEKGKTLFLGNAVKKWEAICSHPNAMFLETLPSAKDMLALVNEKYKKSDTVDVAYFEPFYLKDFVLTKKKS
ncbi:tRNA (adenosine(37)-N6)-threonylcarbamoyltransferase complex dimerization subunit type 1 TsaB [Haloflavibacter putidus]|uniref:tRNA (Adenosine(37)-N6)-threonylcarbamoyltransferase complex dimerization subunit type 1 TsaB n=1 Tax=Haloflavibacter putidus TaxID=2576776 RepID=A0A507ZQL2_9FLAO|nr:tRNA (adenosine(37)-N6)-threonylcarbamoyltransferase complex dimerization subunit type 1 TsaB [Haloflavibacter putidus]TQD39639.1 tRNA (adenosine(37)-N6)-threonylcarbamoyltransferase complex dimerization subunit type 1 TsaB [Haloflavibacter putidus]